MPKRPTRAVGGRRPSNSISAFGVSDGGRTTRLLDNAVRSVGIYHYHWVSSGVRDNRMRTVGIDNNSAAAILHQRRMRAIGVYNHASITVLVHDRVRAIWVHYHRYLCLRHTRTAQ